MIEISDEKFLIYFSNYNNNDFEEKEENNLDSYDKNELK